MEGWNPFKKREITSEEKNKDLGNKAAMIGAAGLALGVAAGADSAMNDLHAYPDAGPGVTHQMSAQDLGKMQQMGGMNISLEGNTATVTPVEAAPLKPVEAAPLAPVPEVQERPLQDVNPAPLSDLEVK